MSHESRAHDPSVAGYRDTSPAKLGKRLIRECPGTAEKESW